MKKTLLALCLIPCLLAAQEKQQTVKINLKEVNPAGKMYIEYSSFGPVTIDSAMTTSKEIEFKPLLVGPSMVTLSYLHDGKGSYRDPNVDRIFIYLDQDIPVVNMKDSLKNSTVTGSPLHTAYEHYQQFIKPSDDAFAALQNEYNNSTKEQKESAEFARDFIKRQEIATDSRKRMNAEYIKKNPDSYFSLAALRSMYHIITPELFGELFTSLSENQRNSDIGKMLGEFLAGALKTAIGTTAPDFTQNDTNGNPVKLSDYRGKYVLIDFWASWCAPCRAENPHLIKAYTKYKDKNFDILGISLDNASQKQAWIDAIKDDQLLWTNVSDLKGFKNEAGQMYAVKAIPQNFLIDPQGKIVASNLRGRKLDEKLAEILDK